MKLHKYVTYKAITYLYQVVGGFIQGFVGDSYKNRHFKIMGEVLCSKECHAAVKKVMEESYVLGITPHRFRVNAAANKEFANKLIALAEAREKEMGDPVEQVLQSIKDELAQRRDRANLHVVKGMHGRPHKPYPN